MLNFIKKTLKLFGSRLIYLFVGLSFALVIIIAQAAITATTVTSGTPLTVARWKTVVDDLTALDARVTAVAAVPLAGTRSCQTHDTATWSWVNCNDGEYLRGISLGNAERPVWQVECCRLY